MKDSAGKIVGLFRTTSSISVAVDEEIFVAMVAMGESKFVLPECDMTACGRDQIKKV
jgi:hypothetical protein